MARPYPVPNATTPVWRTELHELDSHRSTPELPDKQDIVIIGAGFAGAALAHYLLEDNPQNQSITILEAREACSGATGRNGGHLRPDHFVGVASRKQRQGLEAANEVALFEEHIACDLIPVTTADTFVDEAEAAKFKDLYDELRALRCPTLNEVIYHGPEAAEAATRVRGARGAFTHPAATLWPYKLVMHLLARGANLQTHTPVRGVADGEGYWTLATARGATRARRVVFATNAYTSGLLPEYARAIYPARGTACRAVPAAAAAGPTDELLGSCAVGFGSPAVLDSYYGLRPDDSLIVGGANAAFKYSHRDLWEGNFDDATLIQPAVPYFHGWAERTFVGWEEEAEKEKKEKVKVKVEEIWTGIMGYTPDDSAHVGPVPAKPGLFICAGFFGHGMPNVLLCAKGLAKMMRDGSPFSETGVPACYETSLERLQKASV
ncbi:FAD dependent oxidoreductase [Whalleya microplaca]|nr:FAD dependent oxidoreductase [Whalleya microplaca]